jgi:WD40 repeat protein
MANQDFENARSLRRLTDRLKVFISYSRHDAHLAAEIVGGLEFDGGFETLIDSHSIEEGEEWKTRISALIAECGTFIVILSANWANSQICQWELEEAWRHSKRVVPVQATALTGVAIPPRLAAINYVRFDANSDGSPRLFMDGMSALRRALVTDLGWVREHARLLSKAAEWDSAGRISNRMLSGPDIAEAKHWLDSCPSGAPLPTELHRDYIAASEQAEAQRLSVERQRAEALKRAFHRTLAALAVASVAGIAAAGAGLYAHVKELDAEHAEVRAADERDAALLVQSRHLNDIAAQLIEAGDPHTAMLLSLAGLPVTGTPGATTRPYLPELEGRLYESLFADRERLLLAGNGHPVLSAVFSNDGALIATGSQDQFVRVWDVHTGSERLHVKCEAGPANDVAFTPDGRRLIFACGSKAEVIDARTGKSLLELDGHADEVSSVAVSADGSRIVTGSDDRTARVWNAASGAPVTALAEHTGPVSSVAVNADGTLVVTASADATAMIWDVKAPTTARAVLKNHALALSAVALSADGKLVVTASADKSIRVWNTASAAPTGAVIKVDQAVTAIAISADGKRIISGQPDGSVRIWGTATGAAAGTFRGHVDAITHVALSVDGRYVVSCSKDGTARVWDMRLPIDPAAGQKQDGAVTSVGISADGARWVTTGPDKRARVWRAEGQTAPIVLGGDGDEVTVATISPDGSKVLTGGPDSIGRVWDTATGKVLVRLVGHSGSISSVAISPDGRRAATGSEDTTARIWDINTGRQIAELGPHATRVTSLAFSADGTRLLTGSGTSARLWTIDNSGQVAAFLGNSGSVLAVALSHNGQLAASGGRDGSVHLWGPSTNKEIRRLHIDGATATSIAFGGNDARVLSGWSDGRLRVWDSTTGALIAAIKMHKTAIAGIAVAAGTERVVSGAGDGTVRMATFFPDTASLVRSARTQAVLCLTPNERVKYHLADAPPRWCITGAGEEGENDPQKWRPLWPYRSVEWRRWLTGHDQGQAQPLPPSEMAGE